MQRLAYAEAAGHLVHELELLRSLPLDSERKRRELDLQLLLAESLRWTKGVGSEEVRHTLLRAQELCEQVGESNELFAVLHGLEAHYQQRLNFDSARERGQKLLRLAEDANEPAKLMVAHGALGLVSLLSGDFLTARDHLEQASPRLDWERTGFFGIFYPSFGAWALWALGYVEQALKWNHEALLSAEALSRPAPLANALTLTAQLHMFLRDPRMAKERADAAIAVASEHGFPFELAYGTFVQGWALTEQGHLREGIAQMRRSAAALEVTGFAIRPRWFAFLAEACARIDGPDQGLEVLAEGMALTERCAERMYEADVYRVKGELLQMHATENIAEAERCFRTAIEVARRQGAKSLELRATTSLARLLAKQVKRDDARAMLAGIYDWFTEGFDTADLKDAKTLLDELA